MSAWKFVADCNQDLVIRSEIDYFQRHFIGRSMVDDWKPPLLRISGGSKRVRDFVSWMLSAPAISEKARCALKDLIEPYAEILPLIELRGKPYWAVNVLKVVDCLDRERSEISYSPDDGRILNVWKYVFREERLESVPIFKVAGDLGQVFVTRSFVDAVIANSLRGAAFADPGVSSFAAMIQGDSPNVIPGVPE